MSTKIGCTVKLPIYVVAKIDSQSQSQKIDSQSAYR